MKKISILLLTIFIVFGCTEKSDDIWHSNIENAIEIAQSQDKPILLQFSGSDWCHWCKKLNEEVMEKDDFLNYAKDNIILVNLDYPRTIQQTDEVKKYNQEKLAKYNVKGYPTVLLLDKTGKVILRTGYQPGGPTAYIKHIKDAYALK